MADHDEDWLEALAGARAPANAQQQREIDALRRAARALDQAAPDELAERRLLQRLEAEGLLEARHPVQRRSLRVLGRAAVLLLCMGLVMEWFLLQPPAQTLGAPGEADRAAPAPLLEGEQHLAAERRERQAPSLAPPLERAAPVAAEPAHRAAAPAPLAALSDRAVDQARAKAPADASVTLQVLDLQAAQETLLELLARDDIEEWPADEALPQSQAAGKAASREDTAPRRDWRLRCLEPAACELLNAWLRIQGAPGGLTPDQVLVLRLEPVE